MTARQVCSGRWPGVWIARRTTWPSSSSRPSVSASCAYSASAAGWIEIGMPMLEREPAVPGEVIGVRVGLDDADDLDSALRGRREHALDRVRRIDDRGDAGFLVTDQVRRAPEIVVQELLEEHGL